MHKIFNICKKLLLSFFLIWEIFFLSFAAAAPAYAQEATNSANQVLKKIAEASDSAKQIVKDLIPEPENAQIPASLLLPFDSSSSKIKTTSSFGESREIFTDHPGDKQSFSSNKHNGLDFELKEGTEISAVDEGVVLIAENHDYGLTVTIEHNWGKTIYGHLSEISKYQDPSTKQEERILQKGDKVQKGQIIGLSGNTGNSTNPHLHFGIKRDDKFIDPAPLLGLNKIATSPSVPRNDALLEATASAGLENVLGESTASASFEDLRGKSGFKYNYKFNLTSEGAIHFQHRQKSEPGFAVVDKDAQHRLRFFLKQEHASSSELIKIEEGKVEFPVIVSGIAMTLRYTVTESQVKEEFIIDQKPSPEILDKLEDNLTIQFNVENEGLIVEDLGEGAYKFKLDEIATDSANPRNDENTGGEYWQIQSPTVEDSEGQTSEIKGELKDNIYSLSLNSKFLSQASYPITIDPTVIVNTSSTTGATQVSTQRHIVKTSDGTLHNFIQVGTQTATCGGSSSSGLLWFNSTDSGSTWTCQAQLSSSTGYIADARVDSSDNIYVIYSAPTTGAATTSDVFYRKLTKGGGASWTLESAQTVLDGTSTVGYHYAVLELQGTTRIWLASRYYDGVNYQVSVYYSDGLSAAPTWTVSQTTLDTANTTSTHHYPTIVRFGSKIGVIYTNASSLPSWRFRSDSDGLTTWSNEALIHLSGVSGPTFSAVGDSSGNVYAIINSSALQFVYYNGSTWSSSSSVSSTPSNSMGASLSTDGAGNVWVFYGDTSGLSSGLSGSRKLVYKKGIAPFTANDFDLSSTAVVSYHRTFDKYWSFVSSAYTDDTTDAGNSTTADTQMVTATGDIAYFGLSETFDAVSWDLSTNGSNGGTVTWEYCSAVDVNTACTTWSSLTFTSQTSSGASNLRGDGYGAFTTPGDWTSAKVNSESTAYYYIRARTTADYTTSPVGVQVAAIPQINWASVTAPVASNNTHLIWTENAVSPTKIRSASITTTSGTTPSSTAEISPSVLGYSANANTTRNSLNRKVVKTSDGTLHAFIQSAGSSTSQQQACGGSSDSNNNTGLMWLYSTDSGSSWTCGGQLSSNVSTPMEADARVDSADNIYIVYWHQNSGANAAYDIIYRKLTKGSGATWTIGNAQTVLDGTASVGYTFGNIELEGTTRAWIAARYYDGTNYQITTYYSDGLSDAPTWTLSKTNVDTAGTSQIHYPTMVRYGGNKIAIIYPNQSATDRFYWVTRSDSDNLDTWSTEANINTASTFGASTLSAVGDSSGNIYFAANTGTSIIFNYYNGSSWSSTVTVSSAAAQAFVSLSIDNASTPNVYVLYGQTTGLANAVSGNRKLVYKKGVSPFATANFDSNATEVVSYHGSFDKVWSFISSSYTDVTTDAGDSGGSDVAPLTSVGDIWYFGKSSKFDSISYSASGMGNLGGQVIWEYYNGSTWIPIIDYLGTTNPSFGNGYISFIPHSDWSTTTVNGEGTSYYYVRSRVITAYSSPSNVSQFVAIPQINYASLAANTQGMYAIWTENAANAMKVRYSTIQSFNATPSTPSSLGGASYVDGSFGTDTTPDLTFTLADTDSSDTLKYQIQIDDSSDFGSPVVDYTSALAAQGSRTFTVGQAAGSGTYSTGSEGQTLSDGSYYWRVRATDNGGATGSYATANSGSIAFKIDTTAPTAPSSVASTDHTTSTWSVDPTISMSWTAATDTGGSGVAGYYYVFDTSSGTIPTSSDSSTSSTSVTSSSLSSGNSHYFHIRAYDNVGNLTASGSTVHVGPFYIDVTAPSTPGAPSTSNPTSDTTPTWSWTASTDSASGLASTPYTLQWSTDSGFSGASSSTSATNSFTHSTALTEGTWYFRVKAADTLGNESSWASGSVTIDLTSPNTLGLITPADGAFTNQPRPLFTWQAVATGGGNSLSSYTFHIDNGETGDIDISGIPVSRTTDYETSRYVVKYSGFSDTDENNNYLSLYTKSSSDWGSSGNDGQLQEGRRTWSVTAFDTAGNTQTGSRSLYADFTNPTLLSVGVDSVAEIDDYLLVTTTKPKVAGKISDNLAYSQIQLTFYKENYFLGLLTSRTIYKTINHNLNNINNDTTLDFSFETDEEIEYGKYQLSIIGTDKAGNKSATSTFNLNLLTYEKAKELIAQKDKTKLDDLKEGSDTSLADLEKKAQLRREKEAAELEKLFAQIRKDFGFLFEATKDYTAAIGDFFAFHFGMVPEFFADLKLGVLNLASLFNSTATALVMGVFEAGSDMLASAGTSLLALGDSGVKQLTLIRDSISSYASGFASTTYALAMPIVDHSPQFIKTGVTALLITPFEKANSYFDNLNQKVTSPLLADINTGQDGFNKSLSMLIEVNNSITRFADSTGKPHGEYAKTSQYLTDALQSTFDTSKSSSENLAFYLDDSSQKLKNTINQKFMNQNGGLISQVLTSGEKHIDNIYQAGVIASAYLIKPYNETIGFADRTKLWLMTFNSIVLDPNPTQISNVTIEEVGRDYAIVSWDTNHVAWGKANYGKDLTYGQEVFTQGRGTHHVVKFTNLEPGKRFFFEVMSEGKNYTYDAFYSFETPK